MNYWISRIVIIIGLFPLFHSQDDVIIIPPSITAESPTFIWFRNDQTVTLQCSASGEPSPEFSWMINGTDLDISNPNIQIPDPTQGTIVFNAATITDSGYYQCFASNPYGTALSTVNQMVLAQLGFPPANPAITPFFASVGEFLMISCGSLPSTPPAVFSWELATSKTDPNPLPYQTSARVVMDPDGNLYFSNIVVGDDEDGKLYKCNSFNPYLDTTRGISYSSIAVTDQSPPASVPVNQYISASSVGLVGQSITLYCIYSGFPNPGYTWGKQSGSGSDFPTSRVSYAQFQTQMTISNLQHDDAGTYFCRGSNSAGVSGDANIELTINEIPYFEPGKGPENTNATVGDDVTFNCNATGIPTPSEAWMVNGEPISGASLPERMTLSDDGMKLTISDVCKTECLGSRSTDLMVIQCNASNSYGWVFGDGYLNVLLPTQITDRPPTSIQLIADTIFTLPCSGTSDPSTPVFPEWYYEGAPVDYNPPYLTQLESGALQINTNDDSDWQELAGLYSCNLTNGFSSSVAYVSVQAGVITGASVLPWWVFLLIALALVIIILLIVALVYVYKNPGQDYLVDKNERSQGLDPEADCRDMDHIEHIRPPSPVSKLPTTMTGLQSRPPGLGLGLVESPYRYGESEQGSLNEYGDVSFGKFNEDGSFIGQYNTADPAGRAGVVNLAMTPDYMGTRRY